MLIAVFLSGYERNLSVARVTDGQPNQIRDGAWSLNLVGWDDLSNCEDGLSSWYQDFITEQGGAVFLRTQLLSEPHVEEVRRPCSHGSIAQEHRIPVLSLDVPIFPMARCYFTS